MCFHLKEILSPLHEIKDKRIISAGTEDIFWKMFSYISYFNETKQPVSLWYFQTYLMYFFQYTSFQRLPLLKSPHYSSGWPWTQWSSFLSLLSVGIIGMHHHARPKRHNSKVLALVHCWMYTRDTALGPDDSRCAPLWHPNAFLRYVPQKKLVVIRIDTDYSHTQHRENGWVLAYLYGKQYY